MIWTKFLLACSLIMKLFQFQQSFITLQFAISQEYESIWIKMEKIKGFKIITWICYASCHRSAKTLSQMQKRKH